MFQCILSFNQKIELLNRKGNKILAYLAGNPISLTGIKRRVYIFVSS